MFKNMFGSLFDRNRLEEKITELEKQVNDLQLENKKLREESIRDSWRNSVDRQGGAFDNEELMHRENW